MAPKPVRIALVGLMGAGKSRVGRLLAERLAWPFLDGDREIEARLGATIPEIFRDRGEETFREAEAALVEELSRTAPPFVAALGGGAVGRPETRRRLAEHFFTVWIDVSPEEAARRIGRRRGRPLLAGGDPLGILTRLAAERAPWYAEAAHLKLPSLAGTRADALAGRIRVALETAHD